MSKNSIWVLEHTCFYLLFNLSYNVQRDFFDGPYQYGYKEFGIDVNFVFFSIFVHLRLFIVPN